MCFHFFIYLFLVAFSFEEQKKLMLHSTTHDGFFALQQFCIQWSERGGEGGATRIRASLTPLSSQTTEQHESESGLRNEQKQVINVQKIHYLLFGDLMKGSSLIHRLSRSPDSAPFRRCGEYSRTMSPIGVLPDAPHAAHRSGGS